MSRQIIFGINLQFQMIEIARVHDTMGEEERGREGTCLI